MPERDVDSPAPPPCIVLSFFISTFPSLGFSVKAGSGREAGRAKGKEGGGRGGRREEEGGRMLDKSGQKYA